MNALACIVPTEDAAFFGSLPEEVRVDVRRKLRVMRTLLNVGKGIGEAIKNEAAALGCGAGTLRRYYDAYRRELDWRTLIDRRLAPRQFNCGREGVPQWLVTLWQKCCEENNRKMEPAHRALIRLWHDPKFSPPEGEQWPEYDPKTKLPRGCSLGNLRQTYAPSRFELLAMRQGLGAALGKYGPKVLTTRIGLWVGSHYLIDDVKRDMEFLLLGHGGQRVVPLELGVLDLFSGDRFAIHRRPQYRRPDGVKDSLKEREMRFLLASVFRNIGYSPRGTEIVAELGTAAVRDRLKAFLHQHSGEKITVREPGIVGAEQAIAGYYGSGGGNPRHKAPIESHHSLAHNEAGALLAPTGHDRNPPEWLHGLQCITDQVLKWMRELSPERAALFRVPHLEWFQGCRLLDEVDRRIAWRTDHELEGWVECGHTLAEYCVDLVADRWIGPEEFLALPPIAQQRLAAAAKAHPDFARARKLAPREVSSRGFAELVKLPDAVIALMFCDRELGDDLRQPKPKRLTADGLIAIQDTLVAPEEMYFEREIEAANGGTLRLEDRTDYTVALNPFDLDKLWIYGPRAEYLGAAPRRHRASRLHAPEITAALGAREHEIALLTAPLKERHADAARLIEDIQTHNDRVRNDRAAEQLVKAAEKRDAKAARFGSAVRESLPAEPSGTDGLQADDSCAVPLSPTTPTTPNDIETW